MTDMYAIGHARPAPCAMKPRSYVLYLHFSFVCIRSTPYNLHNTPTISALTSYAYIIRYRVFCIQVLTAVANQCAIAVEGCQYMGDLEVDPIMDLIMDLIIDLIMDPVMDLIKG